MKIYIEGNNSNKIGGGWSFRDSFRKCFDGQIVDNPQEADFYLIPSVSMLPKLSVIPWDKKVVLRVDNVLKKSCNRDIHDFGGEKVSLMLAMKQIAQKANLTVFQSQWAKDYLEPYLKPKKSVVILNSVDETIFNPDGRKIPVGKKTIYFYSRSSNHDNKGWHKIYYDFQYRYREDSNLELWIIGRFSLENIPNNFDFFNGEIIKYLGYITDPEAMAMYMRSADFIYVPYSFDACSNTTIEGLMSGCIPKILDNSGGTKEILDKFKNKKDYFKLERMKREYKINLEGL